MNTLLNSALTLTYHKLSAFSSANNFWQVFDTAFGTGYIRSVAEILRLQWQAGDFSQLPQIEILDSSILGGANGAYATSTNKIYLSANYVATATPENLVSTLLEEIGHFVDAQINLTDSAGDEGAIFAELVQGYSLNDATLQALKAEDDHRNITVNGQVIQVEQQNFTGTSGNDTITGTSGNDVIQGLGGNDTFYGGAGNDVFVFDFERYQNNNDIILDFVRGQDTVDLQKLNIGDWATLQKIISNDGFNNALITTFYGSYTSQLKLNSINPTQLQATDFIFNTVNSNDFVDGDDYNGDRLFGGLGNDTLRGFKGEDLLFGEQGNDSLEGGADNDILYGGAGNDIFVFDFDRFQRYQNNNDIVIDFVKGQDRIDIQKLNIADWTTLQFLMSNDGQNNALIKTYSDGIDSTLQLNGINYTQLQATDFIFNTVISNNIIDGNDYNGDRLFGGLGNDTLRGLKGEDMLFGEQGDDRLEGGADNDSLYGGNGNDTAVYSSIRSQYQVINANGVYTVTHQVSNGDGIDTLYGIENIQFSDQTITSNSTISTITLNYNDALEKSILFYEAQRSGNLYEATNRVPWRVDSALNDGADVSVDLTQGYYDAGDHVKFGFPMASSMTMLSWGAVQYRNAYQQSGQLDEIMDAIKWGTDYILKANVTVGSVTTGFWGQVGLGQPDHDFWGPPEKMTMARPAFKIDTTRPGSDLAGEAAAALASASIVFRSTDVAYANRLLQNAIQLFTFAETYKGKYSDSITDAAKFYNSNGYNDELGWAATWLYKATKAAGTTNITYLNKAESYYANQYLGTWTQTWDDKSYGAMVLLAQESTNSRYRTEVEKWLGFWTNKNGSGVTYTPGGLAWLDKWGSLRYAANTAFVAGIYADTVNDPNKLYSSFAKSQVDYILGNNPNQCSYMVGFGNNSPQNPHHRSSHGSLTNNINDPVVNRNILYGAMVGGPDQANDNSYVDDRNNYVTNEVALDYNAGLTGAIARIYGLGGQLLNQNITLELTPNSVTEDGSSNLVYTFTRTGNTTNPLIVNYNIAGTANSSDYTGATPGTGKTITFAANAATATLTINPTADTTVESNETVGLTLTAGTGYTVGTTTVVTGTITNDDPDPVPTINLSGSQTIVEGFTSPQNVSYTVTLSNPSSQTITVNYATANGTAIAGSDYTSTTGTVTFNPGNTSQFINIPILNDNLNEANETFTLTLTNPTNVTLGTPKTVTTTITDTLNSSVTTTLPANVENLTLTGTSAINGTGNAGNNVLNGNNASNTLSGANGNDTYAFIATTALGTDTIVETSTGGIDTIDFSGTTVAANLNLGITTSQTVNSNLKLLLSGNNVIENVIGGKGNDRLTGNVLNNTLNGGDGNDQLQGFAGNDTLWGGLGDDLLTGGLGNDQYNFQANGVFGTGLGVDYITQFDAGKDKIALSLSTFNAITNTVGQALNDFAVVTDDELVNASSAKIVYSQSTYSLFYNRDGSVVGAGTVFEFARLVNLDIALSSSDFILIG